MKLKSLRIKNFRSLKDVKVNFEEDLTCIIGENDAGKTSLLNCIMMFSDIDPYNVKPDDFHKTMKQSKEIEVKLELSDGTQILKKYKLNDENRISQETKTYYLKSQIQKEFEKIRNEIDQEYESKPLQELNNNNAVERLKILYRKLFGQNPRGNSRIYKILEDVEQKLVNVEQKLVEAPELIETQNEHRIYVYYLDNRTIENPSETIRTLFLKDIGKDIWYAQINEQGKTLKEVIVEKLNELKNRKEKGFNENLSQKVSEFLGENIKIKTDIIPKESPIGTEMKVEFIDEKGNIVSFENRGDGTKRRTTMALVEFKLQEANTSSEEKDITIFIFDEPDTHLHVKAQRKLIKKLKEYSQNKQIILTTHSPFIINLLKPNQIRALFLDKKGKGLYTKVLSIEKDEQVNKLLHELGIENTLLFFARKIVITEEKSFKQFLHYLYYYCYNMRLHGDLIHIIEGQGVHDPPRFARVLIDELKYDKDNIIVVVDKDINDHPASEKIKELIEELESKGWNKSKNYFEMGKYKEFEDAFEPETIYKAWKTYLEKNRKNIPKEWTLDKVKAAYEKCKTGDCKLREMLKNLNKGCRLGFDHTEKFPKALAEYCSEEWETRLPDEIKRLLERLKEDL